jgi:LytS/YehU family sensor histidine kinase
MEDSAGALLILVIIILLVFLFRTNRRAKSTSQQKDTLQQQKSILEQEVVSLKRDLQLKNTELVQVRAELERLEIVNMRFVLNPHSFRNTLNSIQNLATKTHKSVVGLSGILDYMLYDSDLAYVPLEKELDFMRQYVELYTLQLRVGISKDIKIDLSEVSGFELKHVIAPMITACFIENAFKHGDMESEEAFLRVSINVVGEHAIVLSVQNGISSNRKHSAASRLGLDNLTKRLNRLYHGRYFLDHGRENRTYKASLRLELHETSSLVRNSG